MSHRSLSVLALGAIAVAVPFVHQPPPLPLGVVDFVKVLDNYPKYTLGKKQLDQEFKDALAEEGKRLQEFKSQQDSAQPGTLARAKADNDFESTYRHYQRNKEILSEQLRGKFDHLLVQCYEDAEAEIAKVATEKQLAMVLRRHDFVGDGSDQDKAQVFERRVVWQAAPELDITAAVIRHLEVTARTAPKPADGR